MSKDIATKVAILISIVVVAMVGFYEREKILRVYGLSKYVSALKNSMAHYRFHLPTFGKNTDKPIAENKEDPVPPIHFEFYTTLPAMQVKVQAPLMQQTVPSSTITSSPTIPRDVRSTHLDGSIKKPPIFDAEKIEQAFHAEIHSNIASNKAAKHQGQYTAKRKLHKPHPEGIHDL